MFDPESNNPINISEERVKGPSNLIKSAFINPEPANQEYYDPSKNLQEINNKISLLRARDKVLQAMYQSETANKEELSKQMNDLMDEGRLLQLEKKYLEDILNKNHIVDTRE